MSFLLEAIAIIIVVTLTLYAVAWAVINDDSDSLDDK